MSEFSVEYDKAEWEAFAKKLGENDERLNRHMKNAMTGTLDYVLAHIVGETPVGATGNLRDSFATNISGSVVDMIGEVATPLIYGWPVETGRAPGRPPPIEPIQYWLYRKGLASGIELLDAAEALRWHIARHGTRGAHMVERAFNDLANTEDGWRSWDYELQKLIEELAQ